MSDATPAFEQPAFESPAFEEDDELEDDFEDEDDEVVEAAAPNRVPDEAPEDEVVNRREGGTAQVLLEHVAKSIVDEPDAVSVEVGEDRNGTRLSLHVAPGDMGRIIGKRGRVAQAIRSLVRAAAAKDGSDATVDIVD